MAMHWKNEYSIGIGVLVAFFENWFISHVLSEDKLFVDFANQRLAHFPA